MPEPSGLPPRPLPPRRARDLVTAWLVWFGPVRAVSTTVAVAVVVAGGYWLVHAPPPPTEAGLPRASATGTVAGSAVPPAPTLPPPTAPAPTAPGHTLDELAPGDTVVVHVAGAVVDPGVYGLVAGSRVHDAIDAAGGPTGEADLDGLNLAAPVADGRRVYVPVTGEVDPTTVLSGGVPGGAETAAGSFPAGPIDINRATAAELEVLPGVGPATAAAIVDDRARNGPFATVDDLDRVPGIGPAKLATIRDLVTV